MFKKNYPLLLAFVFIFAAAPLQAQESAQLNVSVQMLQNLFLRHQEWAQGENVDSLFSLKNDEGAPEKKASPQRSYESSFKINGLDFKIQRNVYPDLVTKQGVIAEDTVSFYFKADLLAKILDQDLEIEGVPLGSLSANVLGKISFEKKFKSYHYHKTEQEAYQSDVRYLLVPYLFFTPGGISDLKKGDHVESEDWLYVDGKAGAHWSGPYGISGDVNATASYYRATKKEISFAEALLPEIRLGLAVEKRAALGIEAKIGLELYKVIQLSILDFGLTYGHDHSYKANYRMTYDKAFASMRQMSELSAAILRGDEVEEAKKYLVAEELMERSFLQVKFTFLLFSMGHHDSVEEREIYFTKGSERLMRKFFKHDRKSDFTIKNPFSLFQGSIFTVIDTFYTLFKGIPYYSLKNSGLEYQFEQNLLLQQEAYSLDARPYLRVHQHQIHMAQQKGLWRWLSKLKLKALFKTYELTKTDQGDWRDYLKDAKTPWQFEARMFVGMNGIRNFLLRDFFHNERILIESCKMSDCDTSENSQLMESYQKAWNIFSHRPVQESDRKFCMEEAKQKAKSAPGLALFRFLKINKYRHLCLNDRTTQDGEERVQNLDIRALNEFWGQLRAGLKGHKGLVHFFGAESVDSEIKFMFQKNNFPYVLKAHQVIKPVLRPSDQLLLDNGLRAPASVLSKSDL